MAYTDEPRGLAIINNINSEALGSLNSQLVWLFGSGVLTIADFIMLTSGNDSTEDAGVFLAGILVAAWTGKSVAGVFDKDNKRKADPRYKEVLEAKERGAAAGAAAAAVIKKEAEAVANGHPVTAERPAAPITQAPAVQQIVNTGGEMAAPDKAKPTGDARRDDERDDDAS